MHDVRRAPILQNLSTDPVRDLFPTSRLFVALGVLAGVYLLGSVWPGLIVVGHVLAWAMVIAVAVEAGLLFAPQARVEAERHAPARFSIGDSNAVVLTLHSTYRLPLRAEVLEEAPVRFQERRLRTVVRLEPGGATEIAYTYRPLQRGVYGFGRANVYVSTPVGLVARRFVSATPQDVAVYPSFQTLRQYELLAAANRLDVHGIKPMRRRGTAMDFDHIREYVRGDDVRTLNWKATARRAGHSEMGLLMVNQHREERAQPVYCVVDTGRTMQMPFDGMTLLDHSLTAALVLAGIALGKDDLAGLALFNTRMDAFVRADRRPAQKARILDALYAAEPSRLESDLDRLAASLDRRLGQRSLVVVFTNFESRAAMRRAMPGLRRLSRAHVVLVVFFENTLVRRLTEKRPQYLDEVYEQTVARQLRDERREMARELRRAGVLSMLVRPQDLTAKVVNEYLSMKASGRF